MAENHNEGSAQNIAMIGAVYGQVNLGGPPKGDGICTVDHEKVLAGLTGRRSYLTESQLPFISPGATHAADPQRLFGLLAGAPGRGVLLVGTAGAGKTRTCFEVAELAHRAGWRVLHLSATRSKSVTVDELQAAVLAAEGRRVLLVIDYLDACSKLDFQGMADELLPEAKRQGKSVAFIGTVRTGSRYELESRGVRRVFTEAVDLREDGDHQAEVIKKILLRAAPDASARWEEKLPEVCGRRPVVALLIAMALEQLLRAGERIPDIANVRSGELVVWLNEALRKDNLSPEPPRSPSTPLGMATPSVDQLAVTVAAAACPQPRKAVEAAVDTFLAGRPGHDPAVSNGASVVDSMILLGWMNDSDGLLEVIHDIVTDELIVQSTMPPPGRTVHQPSARALFDVAGSQRELFVVFSNHVRRLSADLGAKAAVLERFCGEWVADQAVPLGSLLKDAGKAGEQALLTMVMHRPWSSSVTDVWDVLVRPWLVTAEAGHVAGPFLAAALRGQTEPNGPIVSEALAWLTRRYEQTDADHVIRALLRRPDLDPEQEQATVEFAVNWVRSRPGWGAAPEMLNRLFKREPKGDQLQLVAEVAVDWLSARRSGDAAPVLRRVLEHPEVSAELKEAATQKGIEWLKANGRKGADVAPFICILLGRSSPGSERRDFLVECALRWLERHHRIFEAGNVLKAIMSLQDPALTARLPGYATTWIERHPATKLGASLTSALFGPPEVVQESVEVLMERLTRSPHEPGSDALIKALFHHPKLTAEDKATTIDHSFAWLEANPFSPGRQTVLRELLRLESLPEPRSTWVVDEALALFYSQPVEPVFLGALLFSKHPMNPQQSEPLVKLALDWAETEAGLKAKRRIVRAVLSRDDLAPDEGRRAADMALDRLGVDGDTHARELLVSLLNRNDLTEEQVTELAPHTARWLRPHAVQRNAYPVLRAALSRDDLPPETRSVLTDSAEAWLSAHPDETPERAAIAELLDPSEPRTP
jgi:hypothetical protein